MGNKEIDQPSYLTLGRHSYGIIERIGRSGNINVGNFTSIASDVKAIMVGHNVRSVTTFPFNAREIRGKFSKGLPKEVPSTMKWYQDIVIGNDVYIGYGAILKGGIIIHDGAVVGVGSVVVSDVPPYSIVSGNPAQTYRKRFAESHIEELLKIAWWNWPDDKIEQNLDVLCSEDIESFLRRHFK
jgi:acetyltransferase-like isoleucine patch superfamily enzyme